VAAAASRPGRALVVLLLLVVALVAAVAGTVRWGEPQGSWTPKLGLDLEGGTSITLLPRAADQGRVTDENIARAVEIIRQRVDSFGVAESEVAAQGTGASQSIVISIPGRQGGNVLDLVRQTAELRFRRVLDTQLGVPPQPAPEPTVAPPATSGPTGRPQPPATPATPAATRSGTGAAAPPAAQPSMVPAAFVPRDAEGVPAFVPREAGGAPDARRAAAAPAPSPTAPPPGTPAPQPAPQAPATPAPGQPGDVPPQVLQRYTELDCTKPEARRGGGGDDPSQPIAACDQDGTAKYLLGKAELLGTDVRTASSSLAVNSQGQTIPGNWQVNLDFTGPGTTKFAELTRATVGQQVAIVLDGLVVSAPQINEPITGGSAQITGDFDQQEAADLASVLKYGALPLTFDPGTAQEISPTLGSDQLRGGLIAGLLGLGLVVLYSLVYYRGLGLASVASLVVGAGVSYLAVVLLGNLIGFRLSLAGVAGLIVAIGIAADSFVVYFERLRDEVRDGKTLRVAVESGWRRARRTILAADFVSFLAAVVLYVLSTGGVKGFAFTLGLTTLIDVVVVFLFTKPLVTLLARTKFFGGGHRFSGLDPARLGATARPAPAPLRRRRTPAVKEA
jgi:preprotein translocase subunit SecD